MEDGQTIYTLLDGTKLTNNELIAMYRYNKENQLLPVAGYFCPGCNYEVSEPSKDYVCLNCRKEKEN